MRTLCLWENPIDWSYMIPICKHLPGEIFYLYRDRSLEKDNYDNSYLRLDFYKPDNILVFRYDTFNLIKDTPAKKYQFYHGLVDKGFKTVGGQINSLGMDYDYFIEAGYYYSDRMVNVGGVPKNKIVALGYPKLDAYPHFVAKKIKTLTGLDLNPFNKTIFYAPTCREENSLYAYLNADFIGEELKNCLDKMIPRGWQMILKPHDFLDWLPETFEKLSHPEKVKLVYGYNSLEYMACADIVISDCSSIMLEAMACNKPVIQYVNNEKNFKKECCDWWNYTTKVNNLISLQEAIELYGKYPDYKSIERKYYTELMFVNLFESGKVVAKFIENNSR